VFPCAENSKEPLDGSHGCLEATTDIDQIHAWWGKHPKRNVAISTEGLFVLDIDPDGAAWLSAINTTDLLRGTITKTPRNGRHYWFMQNGVELRCTTGVVAPGVDTRANGGYVLVPPSVVNGKPYEWLSELEQQQPAVPQWLIDLLGVRQPLRESAAEQIPEGSRNQTMIKFAGYFRRAGMSEVEIRDSLISINSQRCTPPISAVELGKVAKSAARFEPDFIESAVLMSHFGGGDELDECDESDEPLAVFPQECLQTMPSVMREAFDYVLESAIKPQPELTLGALVALFGTAFGRKVCDDYGTRTNVMVLGLSPSGSGKEHPRQCNKLFMQESGDEMAKCSAPERIGSHAGIISAMAYHPVRLFQLDEIGRLLATMRDPKVSHLYNVGTVLMALYSSANTMWTGDAYADLDKVKKIDQPHICVFGTSVPESLYSGLSPDNLTDGLVGRLIVFQSLGIPDRRKPVRGGLPWRVTETLRQWADFKPPGGGNLKSGRPIEAGKTHEADKRHEAYCDVVNSRHRTEDAVSAAVWSRAPEKAAKLALIFACCGAATHEVVVTLDAENWGIKLANYSTRLVLQACRAAVSGSKYEADLKFVFSSIVGDTTQNQLTRKTQRLHQRERIEILHDLQTSGAIKVITETTGKRPKTIYQRLRKVL
jgi:hypothetical protein